VTPSSWVGWEQRRRNDEGGRPLVEQQKRETRDHELAGAGRTNRDQLFPGKVRGGESSRTKRKKNHTTTRPEQFLGKESRRTGRAERRKRVPAKASHHTSNPGAQAGMLARDHDELG